MLPPHHLRDAEHLLLRVTLEKVDVLHQRGWIAARRGDAPAAIATAIPLLPITQVTLPVDLAMSAVLLAALGGDAAARIMLAHVLRNADLDHPFAIELAESWGGFMRRSAICPPPLHTSRPSPSRPDIANRGTSHGVSVHTGTPVLTEGELT
jgi:hypothetical protein